MFYKGEILETTQAICKAFGSLGWTVDMIVDYGSHARGEARKDSDYDVNIYVHRPGWLYLFEEYAQRLVKQENEIVRWHEQIRQYFSGYKELSGELEQRAQKAELTHPLHRELNNLLNAFADSLFRRAIISC